MKKYTLIWSFRNRIDILKQSIATANISCPNSIDFLLIDGNSSIENIRLLRSFCNQFKNREIRINESFKRTSLAQAWNLGIMLSNSENVIFSSSDVIFNNNGWIQLINNEVDKGGRYILLENHAVFCLSKQAIKRIGYFDERYENGPHFDAEYMIRASEADIDIRAISKYDTYSHGDTNETPIRTTQDVKDRLPMNKFHNEEYFKDKWETDWPGWKNYVGQVHLPHPPTNISQVKRKINEINWHPSFL